MRCLNGHLEWFYSHYALLVYRHTYLFIIVPVSLTLCFTTGFLLVNDRMVNDTIYLVTPYQGQWRREKAAIMDKWPYDEDAFVPGLSLDARRWLNVIVTTKNGSGGLVHNETLDEILGLNDFIMDNFTVRSLDGSTDFTYGDVCLRYRLVCFGNGHVIGLRSQNTPNLVMDTTPKVRYPITREYLTNDPLHVGYLLGGVELNDTDDSVLNAQAIRLLYFNRRYPTEVETMTIQFREGIQNYLINEYRSDLIAITFANEDSANQGIIENARYYAPEIALAFAIMLTFSFLNSFIILQKDGFIGIDWIRSKPLLAVFGLTSPCLAIASTMGLMILIGMPFHPMLVVMPFIVLAIGVNDMFIMMAAWHCTKKSDPPEVRFRETLREAAVSITITSVSDIVAFAIATWNDLPGIQLFCAYTSVGFFFELFYQCTYYAAAIAVFAKMECERRHCITLRKAPSLEEAKNAFQRRFLAGTIVSELTTDRDHQRQNIGRSSNRALDASDYTAPNTAQRLVRKYYVPALMHPCAKFLALLLFLAYIGFGIWGCTIMGVGLPPDKLVLKGHYSEKFLRDSYTYWLDGTPLEVVVGQPANVSLSEGRQEMLELVSAFENTSHSLDERGTLFWMREYMTYLNQSLMVPVEDSREHWCENLKTWLSADGKGTWIYSIKWGNESAGEDPCKITAFRFVITTKNFGMFETTMVQAVPLFRSIAESHAQYEVTTYSDLLYAFADQYLIINSTMTRNGILAFIAMIIISMLMIPHPVCAIFISLSTASIDIGVVGFLAWWGINMDGLTMANAIMATGFAVDLTAHVSYAYVRSQGSVAEKVRHSVEELGWPVFQGVTSTLLGFLVLGLVDSYMYQIFFKTIFLVIMFGILHSLFFLPVALTVFAPKTLSSCRKRKPTTSLTNGPSDPVKLNDTVNGAMPEVSTIQQVKDDDS